MRYDLGVYVMSCARWMPGSLFWVVRCGTNAVRPRYGDVVLFVCRVKAGNSSKAFLSWLCFCNRLIGAISHLANGVAAVFEDLLFIVPSILFATATGICSVCVRWGWIGGVFRKFWVGGCPNAPSPPPPPWGWAFLGFWGT